MKLNTQPADGRRPRDRPPPDGRRDRRGDARPQPLDARRDAAAADHARRWPRPSVHLYKPISAIRWRNAPSHGGTNRRFEGQNPAAGAVIDYALAQKAEKMSLKIVDVSGTLVSELRRRRTRDCTAWPGTCRGVRGQRRLSGWVSVRAVAEEVGQSPGSRRRRQHAGTHARWGRRFAERDARAAAPAGRFGGFGRAASVTPGLYRVVLTVDGKEYSETVRVEPDPSAPIVEIAADDDEMTADEEEFEPMTEEGEEEEGPDKSFDPSLRN